MKLLAAPQHMEGNRVLFWHAGRPYMWAVAREASCPTLEQWLAYLQHKIDASRFEMVQTLYPRATALLELVEEELWDIGEGSDRLIPYPEAVERIAREIGELR